MKKNIISGLILIFLVISFFGISLANAVSPIIFTQPAGLTQVMEGGAGSIFSAVLSTQPTADVVLTGTSTDSRIVLNANPLIFSSTTWNIAQDITVTATSDTILTGDVDGAINYSTLSLDPIFNSLSLDSLPVRIFDSSSSANLNLVSPTPTFASYINTTTAQISITANRNLASANAIFDLGNGGFENNNFNNWSVSDAGWSIDTSTVYQGSYVAKSSNSDGSWIIRQINFPVDTTISFRWLISAFSSGTFYIDGIQKNHVIGTALPIWNRYSVSVTSGAHELKWLFTKGSHSAADSVFLLDSVEMGNLKTTSSMTITNSGSTASASLNVNDLPQGAILYYIDAIDSFGMAATTTYNYFIVDTVSPTSTLSSLPAATTTSKIANISVGGTDVEYYKYQLNGNSFSPEVNSTTTINFTDLPVGSNTLNVIGRDSNNNWQTVANQTSYIWNIIYPQASISNLPENNTTQTSASINVAGLDITHYKYKLDSADWSSENTTTSAITLSGLSLGSHSLAVIGRNMENNWQAQASSTNYSWNIVAPTPVSSGGGGGGGGGGGSGYVAPVVTPPLIVLASTTTATSTVATTTPTQITQGIIIDETAPVARVLGVKTYANGSILKAPNKKVYLIDKNQKKQLTAKDLKKYKKNKIFDVAYEVINQYPDYRADGTMVKSVAGKIYVISGGKKHYVATLKELWKYRNRRIYVLPNEELNKYKNF